MTILSTLIEISIYSAVILLAILLFKKILRKKLSAGIQFALWSLFILRLLLPFSIDSGLHLVTYTEPIQPVVQVEDTTPATNTSQEHSAIPITFSDEPKTLPAHTETTKQQDIIEVGQDNETPQPAVSAPPTSLSPADIVTMVWLMGILIFLMFRGISYIKLRKRIMTRSTALIPSDVMALIQQCEQQMGIKHPCEVRISNDFGSTVLLAALRPKLIIPTHMLDNPVVLEHCLLHEFAHYRRRDYLTYLLTNLLCAVYWFNPCVWIGTRLMKQDMESACDALVIKTMNDDERDKYARTLLSMFSNQPKRFQIAMGMGIATKKEAEKRLRGVYMKRKTSIGTKLTVALLALVMLTTCFTTACQPQPQEEKSVEVASLAGKITETSHETVQKTQKTATPKMVVPEQYTYSATLADGDLTISADAPVTVPQTSVPVVQVSNGVFTQEMVKGMIDYLYADRPYYRWPWMPLTKQRIEHELESLNKRIKHGKYEDEEELNRIQERIAKLEGMYDDAPKVVADPEAVLWDGTMWEGDAGQEIQIFSRDELTKESDSMFMCRGNGYLSYRNENVLNNPDNIAINFTMEGAIPIKGDTDVAELEDTIGISLGDTEQTTQAFLDAGGFKDMKLAAVYAIDDHGTGHVDGFTGEADNYAFKFYYTYCINGSPALVGDVGNGWNDRSLKIIVTSKGIAEISWYELAEYTVMDDEPQILDFASAAEIFQKTVANYQSVLTPEPFVDEETGEQITPPDTVDSIDITIDDVKLGMLQLKDEFIPVWAFYGTVVQKNLLTKVTGAPDISYNDHCDFPQGPYIVLAVNALDGTVIQ